MTSKPAGSSSGPPLRRTLIAGAAALATTASVPAAPGSDRDACLDAARAILVCGERDRSLKVHGS
ncbi:hypothetical protein [Streptomyces sp. NPDC005795]|uniref:hypothetical protein n=1 Tax=Streptomyces sp. NPDC005795 TaxID=3154677 RepID=UPI0033F3EBA5